MRGTSEAQTTAIDDVIGTLGDANSDNTLIGDLAFEQVSSGIRKPHRTTAAAATG
jgi:hypothetical protein